MHFSKYTRVYNTTCVSVTLVHCALVNVHTQLVIYELFLFVFMFICQLLPVLCMLCYRYLTKLLMNPSLALYTLSYVRDLAKTPQTLNHRNVK